MTSLSTRIAAAQVGSRELDAEVYCVVNGFEYQGMVNGWFVARQGGRAQQFSPAQPVTTSLDATVALLERVLPGWWFTVGRCGLTCHASVGPDRAFIQETLLSLYDDGFNADLPNPSTPALALCVAILKAVESKA